MASVILNLPQPYCRYIQGMARGLRRFQAAKEEPGRRWSMPTTLEVRREGATAIFEINRPEDQNKIDMATMDAMIEQVGIVDRDASVRTIVLTGRGEYFCAGGRIGGYPV